MRYHMWKVFVTITDANGNLMMLKGLRAIFP